MIVGPLLNIFNNPNLDGYISEKENINDNQRDINVTSSRQLFE